MNFSEGKLGEIKPLSISGVTEGYAQLLAAIKIANGIEWDYNGQSISIPKVPHYFGGQPDWTPEDWSPGIRALSPAAVDTYFRDFLVVTLGNYRGLILYKRFRIPRGRDAAEYAKEAVRSVERLVEQLGVNDIGELDPATLEVVNQTLEWTINTVLLQQLAIAGGVAGAAYLTAGIVHSMPTTMYTARFTG